ncbi:MAG: 3-phenylpropionate/trans-cinnamate dioxygenase ferredoxin reductase component [Methylobacteriaceae bacterium]|nr:3-phenylpropionate/trans-cinnamate dioxygenase ferredoxin reductase component [Methylobacteriaceae bacterium]
MTYQVAVGHSDIVFPAKSGETVLDAAERAGYSLPYSCRKGVCSTCEAGLRAGAVEIGARSIEGPASAVLLCRAKPVSDIVVHPRRIERRDVSRTKVIDAWVFRLNWPTEDVATLLLRFPVSIRAKFKAGQYLRVLSPDGTARNFSLANPPQESDGAHLHIRHIEGGRFSEAVLEHLKLGDRVKIELPFGDFFLREDTQRPIICLATGASFAPVKSIVEYLIRRDSTRPVRFYWSGRRPHDLYMRELPEKWARKLSWFEFTPVLTAPDPSWSGRKGLVHRVVLEDVPDLSNYQVYACGNPLMIRKARADFAREGRLPEDQFFAEPFVLTGT